MTLTDNHHIYPRPWIRLLLVLLSLTHCNICYWTTSTISSTVDPTYTAPSNVMIISWTTTKIGVSWTHDKYDVDMYKITATCVSAESCENGTEFVDYSASFGTVRYLTPGAEYEIIVWALYIIGYQRPSPPENKRTDPNTVVAQAVISPNRSTDSVKITWERPFGLISSYRIECISSTGGDPHIAQNLTSDTTEYTCTGLSAGHLYTMSVYTVSGTGNDDDKLESEPASKNKRVYPNVVVALTLTSPDRSTNTIEGTWTRPFGLVSGYRTECISSPGGASRFATNLNFDTISHHCTGLSAGHLYTMSVYTISGAGNDEDELESEPASEIKRVYPNVVVSLAVISPDRSTNSIKGTWARPFGLISGYRIECISSTGGDGHNKDLDSDTTEYTCTGLSAGHFYTMSVHTVSGTGHDDDKLESEPVSGDKRVYPNVVVALAVHSPDRSTTSIKAKWVRPFGLISSYTIECISSTGGVPRFAQKLNSYTTAYTCTGLSAGHLYMMSVYTASGTENDDEKLESEPASKVKRVYPEAVLALTVTSHARSTSSLTGSWTKPNSLISSYRVECTSSTGGNPYEGEYLDSNFEYDCTGLSAGHLYTMSVYTVSGTGNGEDKLESEPASKVKRVYPETATVLTTATTHDSFIITWTQPDGHSTGYTFTYEPIDNRENAKSGNEEILDLDQAITSHAIGGLYAGTKYSVDLFTKSGQDGDTDPLQGDPETETNRTIPGTASNIRAEHIEIHLMDIAWDIDVKSLYDEFTVIYTSHLDARQHFLVTSNTSTRLLDLHAGDTYTLQIYTNSDDKTSGSSVPVNITTEPLGPGMVKVTYKNDKEIHLEWSAPSCRLSEDCNYDSYKITHEPEHGDIKHQWDLALTAKLVTLNPGELYNITVQAVSGVTESQPEITRERTMPDTPGNFRIANKTVASLLAAWDKPTGKLESYSIAIDFVNEERDKTLDNVHIPLPDKDDENPASNITGLDPFTEYRLTLTCLSPEPMRTECDPTYIEEKTDIAPPPPSDVRPSNDPEVIMKTKTTIVVEFTDDIFKHDYGPVLYYSVIVTEDNITGGYYDYQPERGTDPDPQMNTWAKAQGRTLRYQIEERYEYPWPYGDVTKVRRRSTPSSVLITIGENTVCKIDDSENYCNGPLKKGTPYRFRGYTEGGYSDTELSEPIITDTDITWPWILLGVLGGLLLAITVILGVILFLGKYPDAFKRKREPSLTGNENAMSIIDEGKKGTKRRTLKHSKPVKLSEYDDYFNTMSADIEFLFSEEYKELRNVGRDQTWDVSELSNNRSKNRYSNIVPYDRTRVLLSIQGDDETSDYINANWIPGNNSPKEFIATQGPLPETKDDFWRMIWEYNVKTVVMLTECTERGKVKCDHYWPPDNEPVHYGDIQVNIVSEEMFAEWTLKEFNLENGGRNKRVRHFNFTAWSDYGVPEATQPLLHFVRAVREQIPDYIHPVIVHCSSGVGRTGTFVALDRLIQHMRDNDYVDIYGIACEMRMHRMYMIQTESQYVFIHQCVADLLHEEVERGEDNFPSPQFHEHTYGNVSPIRAAKSDIVANYGM